jgi:holo-[acyl-carrier protein] synthase
MGKLRVGIDIVDIGKFNNLVEKQGEKFLRRIFNLDEIKDKRIEHIAGKFCAKEALVKAGVIKVGCWKDVSVINQKSGRPELNFKNKNLEKRLEQIDISISHDGGFAVSMVMAVIKNRSN